MTPAITYHDDRPRHPRDVGTPLPSKMLRRDEIKVGDVIVYCFEYKANGLPDWDIGKVTLLAFDFVGIMRRDGTMHDAPYQRHWEVVDSSEFKENQAMEIEVNGTKLQVYRPKEGYGYVHYTSAFGIETDDLHEAIAATLGVEHWTTTVIGASTPSDMNAAGTVNWVLDFAPSREELKQWLLEVT